MQSSQITLPKKARSFYSRVVSKGDETRAAILDEALTVASRVGFTGLTIGQLAEQTGMSKSGLFAHFQSKEQLQLQTLAHARRKFVDLIVRPALTAPRGEKRMRSLFEHWLTWETEALPGGCIFITGSIEFDDQPGPMRDALVADQRDWLDTIAAVAETAIAEGDFRADLDPRQVAFEIQALVLGYHHSARLLDDEQALDRVHAAFDAILARARAH
jgi:AcrR family transcriptional regulator